MERVIRSRLLVTMFAMLLAVTTALVAAATLTVRQQTQDAMRVETASTVQVVQQAVITGSPAEQCQALLGVLQQSSNDRRFNARSLALRTDGSRCGDADFLGAAPAKDVARPFVSVSRSDVDGEPVVAGRGSTRTLNDVPVEFAIARATSDERRAIRGLAVAALGLLLAGIGVAGFAAALLARRLARPIASIARATRELSLDTAPDGRLGTIPGAPVEIAGLATDIDDLLAQIEAAREQQARLVADAAHELRAPVGALRVNLSSLELAHDQGRFDIVAETLTDLTAQAADLNTTVEALLTLARDPVPTQHRTQEWPSAVVATRIDVLRRRWPTADISLTVDNEAVESHVDAPLVDLQLLERAIDNMVTNAMTHGCPPVEVHASESVDGWAIRVRDHGAGVDDVVAARMFDRFARFPSRHTGASSGLGGAIIARAAHDHGGTVIARRHPDGGTEILLRT